jgi:hypothetical protein
MGGIGSSTAKLARMLVHLGHDVTILYARHPSCHDAVGDVCNFTHWKAQYARDGVTLAFPTDDRPLSGVDIQVRAARAHAWLQEHEADFDAAVFPDYEGLAFYALTAKHLGRAYARLPLVILLHGASDSRCRSRQAPSSSSTPHRSSCRSTKPRWCATPWSAGRCSWRTWC